jgi:hypothetical protein
MMKSSSFAAAAALALAAAVFCPGPASAHSSLTDPQPFSPIECRMGGQASYGINNCEGPCDMSFIKSANYGGVDNPAATYTRGQVVNVKYTRNNHAPGGFNRLTLVPVDKMMDKAAHAKGAFHYSCWGAGVTVASQAQIAKDGNGYNVAGVDGEQHSLPPAFYSTDATIPDVIPDGDYIFGWAWFGGTGGTISGGPKTVRNDNTAVAPKEGFFGEQAIPNLSSFLSFDSASFVIVC